MRSLWHRFGIALVWLQDPPFGIHLCGSDFCVLPDGPVKPVHDDRVRPYRGIPIFKPSTIVQHYLAPEEMLPFHQQVLAVDGSDHCQSVIVLVPKI